MKGCRDPITNLSNLGSAWLNCLFGHVAGIQSSREHRLTTFMWQRAKNKFKSQHGSINGELIPDYLVEFMWLQRFKDSPKLGS